MEAVFAALSAARLLRRALKLQPDAGGGAFETARASDERKREVALGQTGQRHACLGLSDDSLTPPGGEMADSGRPSTSAVSSETARAEGERRL